MATDRWQEIQRLFQEALRQGPDERRAYLERECPDDPDLRAEVESLLAHHHDASTDFCKPAPSPADQTVRCAAADAGREDEAEDDRGAFSAQGVSLSLEEVQRLVGERYRIERSGGSGGMGLVYAATDTVLRRRVAVKLLRASAADTVVEGDSEARKRERILAEARAMAGLRHPTLCPVHEVSVEAGVPFIVMEWIDGIDLRSAWRSADLNHRLTLLIKVVQGVAVAHDAGVVHGDLKPGNILVDRMGVPIIVDFGLARTAMDSISRQRLWGGTPGYAAPEQFEGDGPIGPEADVYALGALMYEMLADRLPFVGARLDEVQRAVREQDPPLPEAHAPGVPWPLQRICLVALERDPQRRYVDAHAMAADLHRYLRGETVAARPSMLTDQFVEQVEGHIEEVDSWRRRGMVTESEAGRLTRVLSALLRPESHWILESRRLTLSQVTLYLGGWLALIALTVGMFFTFVRGDMLEEMGWVRYATAFAVAAGLLTAGSFIQRRGHRQISLGYQITACLAAPAALWLLFWETEWLGAPMEGREWAEVFGVDYYVPGNGVLNRQILIILLAWMAVAALLRRAALSSAFTPFVVIAGNLTAVAAWASVGLLSEEVGAYALLGLWVFAVGAVTLGPGLRINRREEEHAQQFGLMRARTHDSWAILAGSLIMIGTGLTLMAYNAADLYTLGAMDLFETAADGTPDLYDRDNSTVAVAFIINGVILQGLSHLLERRRTPVRVRLTELIRWVSPSHFLAGILVLHLDADGHTGLFWLVLLAVAAISLCYVSVWKQWRPFFFTGLGYIAIAYVRAFEEVFDRFERDSSERDLARAVLVCAVLVLGIVTMLLAWKLPGWIAALKIGRWSRRT